jgi:hypothetical protein
MKHTLPRAIAGGSFFEFIITKKYSNMYSLYVDGFYPQIIKTPDNTVFSGFFDGTNGTFRKRAR